MILEQYHTSIEIINDINKILLTYGIEKKITLLDITITEKTISDGVKENKILSDSITNHLLPEISAKTVYHYTSMAAAEAILNSGVFRLYSLEKRYGEGEIETFCITHALNGYLQLDENGIPLYKNLIMPNTYYASFSDTNLTKQSEEYLWRTFASCNGVRLKLRIKATNPYFRKIIYEGSSKSPIPLLSELTNTMLNKYNRDFILSGISKFCAFYLSGCDYEVENEFRVLYTSYTGMEPQPIGIGAKSYIEVPLSTSNKSGYLIDVLEVESLVKPEMPKSFIFSQRNTKMP